MHFVDHLTKKRLTSTIMELWWKMIRTGLLYVKFVHFVDQGGV